MYNNTNNTIRPRGHYNNYNNNSNSCNSNNRRSELPKVKARDKDKLDSLLDNALIDKGVNRGKYVFNPFELYCAEALVNMGGDPHDVSLYSINIKLIKYI